MSEVNPLTLIESFKWRYATKRFDPARKISEADWNVLTESLRLAPSSYGLQPWRFLVIQTPELRKELQQFSWNQSQVVDASHYLVFTSLTKLDESYVDRFVKSTAETRSVPVEKLAAYRKMMVGDLVTGPRAKQIAAWSQRQTYIAMGFLLETASLLGIDTCPIEGLEPLKYDQILNLEGTGYSTVAAVALGYRHPEDQYQSLPKVRFSEDEVFEYR